MSRWPSDPVIYELNTGAWLHDVGQRAGNHTTLATVSPAEWDAVTPSGVDAVWLMGVWERSPAGVALALESADQLASFRSALPDVTDADIIGSAYCIRNYETDSRFGSRRGLAAARTALAERGVAEIDAVAYEAWRIEAGVPRQGYDIDESTIAQEAYLDRDAVSFTKGCFVGQELVCRIDTRGHVNRLLRRLRADVPMAQGAGVEVDGKAVGTVTSAAGQVALALLRREVEPTSTVLVGSVTARVESLEA